MLTITAAGQQSVPSAASLRLADVESHFVRGSLWTVGATPEIETERQYAYYQRLAAALSRKYDAERRRSLSFIRSHDGVLFTSLEARLMEWERKRGWEKDHCVRRALARSPASDIANTSALGIDL